MGYLDPAPTSPLVQQVNAASSTPAAVVDVKKPPATANSNTPPAAATPPDKPSDSTPIVPPDLAAGGKAALAAIGKLEQQRDAVPKPPSKPELPAKPRPIQEEITMWGALAIAFAGFASLRTRTPMTSALNAAGAAITAMRQGQKEQADAAYKQWEADTKLALETANYERQAYQDLMSDIDRREGLAERVGNQLDAESRAKMEAMTSLMRDPVMADAARTEGVAGMKKVQQAREAQAEKLKESTKTFQDAKEMQTRLSIIEQSPEYQQAKTDGDAMRMIELRMKAAPVGSNAARTLNTTPLAENEVNKLADLIIAGKMSFPSDSEISSKIAMRQVADAVTTKAPNYDPSDYKQLQQAKKQLLGKDGDNIRSFTVLAHHLQFFEELSKELKSVDSSDVQAINSVTNRVAKQFGMPQVTSFEFATQLVGDEMTKAILGSGAGGVTDRNEMKANLNSSYSEQQLQGVVDAGRGLVQGQLAGQVSKYRHLIEIGWLKPEDVVPAGTLRALGVTSVSDPKALMYPPGADAAGEKAQRVNVEGTNLSIPNPNLGADQSKADKAAKAPESGAGSESEPIPLSKDAYESAPPGAWFVDAQGRRRQKAQ